MEKRVQSWKKNRAKQHGSDAQLEWESHVVEYVGFLWDRTKIRGSAGKETSYLSKDVPLIGPRFIPPSYSQLEMRQHTAASGLSLESAYIKPINVHPLYYRTLARCPKCKSTDVVWDGWTSTGARDVHGICKEERAIGYQLRCSACEKSASHEKVGYCWATTNHAFWQDCEHWQIPCQLNFCLKRVCIDSPIWQMESHTSSIVVPSPKNYLTSSLSCGHPQHLAGLQKT